MRPPFVSADAPALSLLSLLVFGFFPLLCVAALGNEAMHTGLLPQFCAGLALDAVAILARRWPTKTGAGGLLVLLAAFGMTPTGERGERMREKAVWELIEKTHARAAEAAGVAGNPDVLTMPIGRLPAYLAAFSAADGPGPLVGTGRLPLLAARQICEIALFGEIRAAGGDLASMASRVDMNASSPGAASPELRAAVHALRPPGARAATVAACVSKLAV